MGKVIEVNTTCDYCKNITDSNDLAWEDTLLTFNGEEYIVDICKSCWADFVAPILTPIASNARQPEEQQPKRKYAKSASDGIMTECAICKGKYTVRGLNRHINSKHPEESDVK